MKTLTYYGAANFNEYLVTGRVVTWTQGQTQSVDDSIAAKLVAYSASFTYASADPEFIPARVKKDSNGNVISILNDDGTDASIGGVAKNAMTSLVIGNSITTAQKYGGLGVDWITKAEIHIANALAGSPLRFPRITASTRADQYGVYGYSGQTLPTILADLPGQLWTQVAAAGVVPDLVFGLSLLENDISSGASYNSMVNSIKSFVINVTNRYPGAILCLATPRPSFSYDTPAKVLAYQQIRDYILSLDDANSIFVARLDTYENPDLPGTPLGTSSNPIFTDSSVHPNGKGAFRNARVIADMFNRISKKFKQSYYCVATNIAMDGSQSATGTNVSGTAPTNVTVAGSANGVFVITAEQPGMLQTITANASGVEPPVDLSNSNVASVAISGGANTQLSPFIEFEIVSGAENIAWLQIRPRFSGSVSGNVLTDFVKRNTNDVDPEFRNGDILKFVVPPRMASDITGISGNFAGCQVYWEAKAKISGGQFSFRVRTAGVGIVVP